MPPGNVFLDGFVVPVRRDGRVVRNPVLIAVGVRGSSEKVLLTLRLAGGESTAAWRSAVENLAQRGVTGPALGVVDGSPGLRAAVGAVWPDTLVGRCAVHKLHNLLAHAPRQPHEAIREDFHWITQAASLGSAKSEEGGPELLTFYRFPKEQWKSLRTTNVIEAGRCRWTPPAPPIEESLVGND